MLNNIKSDFFVKFLFSYLDEKQKLYLLKYNKSLQKLLNINIINYQCISGRYIIYEKNGIGKEYNGYSNLLVYAGEYLNGKRNGKGKEYFGINNIEFEGEYLNDKKNGKGK